MKNNPSKHPGEKKGKRLSPPRGRDSRKAGRRKARKAETTANNAQKLYKFTHELQHRADQLHHALEATHNKARALHDGAEAEDLILEKKRPSRGKPFLIVGIGASAGGFEAVADFLGNLPTNTGMAFILIQHLDPKHKSRLSELLGHATKVPVLEATQELEVKPNHFYVIPENVTLTIQEGRLRLLPRMQKDLPPMPIDTFFRSLAAEQQNRSVGIVLSGTGTDGTLGIESIKGEGGITFSQDENSSKYFGMPGSAIASGSIDFVMSPADIALELGRIAEHPYVGLVAGRGRKAVEPPEFEKLTQEGQEDLNKLFRLLRHRAGVDFALYKRSTLQRRIIRRMVLHKTDTLGSYVRMLEAQPAEIDALFNDLLINVTSFFRDPKTFQILKSKVFPRLIKGRDEELPLRMWACGCATGEEAYSLAMALMEFFDQTRNHRRVQIFATDISEASVEKARVGIYAENIAQDVSPERLRRFFSKVNGNYQVHKTIRDMCIFARQNVVVDPPFSNLDLVTCRNVLIYLGPMLQRKIIPSFHYSLRTNGFLVLGNSETIGSAADDFVLVDKKHKIYQKKPSYARPEKSLGRLSAQSSENRKTPELAALGEQRAQPDLRQLVDAMLLRDFSPGAVVVNSEFDVLLFRGRTGDYLEHSPGIATLNLMKMARDSLVLNLRAALAKASRYDKIAKLTAEVREDGTVRDVMIEVVPFRVHPAQDRFFLVVFREPNRLPELGRSTKNQPSRKVREQKEMGTLRQELQTTRESLQSIIEEQEATNEELKSANEEIQSSNEELQSTNEELETAKEELQSTNEELTTLNEELNNNNAELTLLNNDLSNLLSSSKLAILMLANDLTLRRCTPMAERVFDLVPGDIGRNLGELQRPLLGADLESTVREVIDNLVTLERETEDREGRRYLLRIRPYRTRENKIDGAVIAVIDIDDLCRALDVILLMVNQPLVILGPEFKVRKANDAFYSSFHLDPKQLTGKPLHEADAQFNTPELLKLSQEFSSQNNRIKDLEFETEVSAGYKRRLHVKASRIFEENRGFQIVLLALDDIPEKR